MSRKKKNTTDDPTLPIVQDPAVKPPLPLPEEKKFIPVIVPFWSFSWREVVVDAGMIVFSILFSKSVAGNGNIVDSVSPIALLLIFCGVVFFMPMYLAYLHPFYKAYYGEAIGKAVKVVFWCIVGVMLIFLLVIIFHTGGDLDNRDPVADHFMMFGMFILVLGPMTSLGGNIMGEDALKNQKSTDGVMMASIFIGLAIGIAAMIWMMFVKDPQQMSGLWGFLYVSSGLFVAAFVCVIVIGIGMAIQKLIEKMHLQTAGQQLFSTLLPFLIAIMLIFWNEAGIGMMREGLNTDVHPGAIIPLLFVTGYIPFRVVLMCAPPIRGINLIIGIAGIVYFLLSSAGVL